MFYHDFREDFQLLVMKGFVAFSFLRGKMAVFSMYLRGQKLVDYFSCTRRDGRVTDASSVLHINIAEGTSLAPFGRPHRSVG